MPFEIRHGDYLITDDPARLDLEAIHGYLAHESYWAGGVPREVVERAVRNSLCLGIYSAAGAQVGLARIVTDYATFAWLCDVFVLEAHRRHGLGKALIQAVLAHPRLQGLRRFSLATRDAHGLYAQFGFTPPASPQSLMERRDPDVYRRAARPS
ncbi:MAG TPA: GNAT family N-acetyltransferase [Opitutus sp.]|nr:GNAT family N-acetyltransferase [Opitutus sp.]